MKTSISIGRLFLYIRKQGFENLRFYVLSTLSLFIVLFFAFIFWLSTSGGYYSESSLGSIFFPGLFLGGTIFASYAFHMLHSKDGGIYWLTLPASHLEKLIAAIFYHVILFFVIYCLVFFILKIIFWAYVVYLVQHSKGQLNISETGEWRKMLFFLKIFLAVQSFYLLGSVYFTRFAFIKTTITGAIILLVLGYYYYFLDTSFDGFELRGRMVVKQDGDIEHEARINHFLQQVIFYAATLAWAPLFWVASFFRLKEKEI